MQIVVQAFNTVCTMACVCNFFCYHGVTTNSSKFCHKISFSIIQSYKHDLQTALNIKVEHYCSVFDQVVIWFALFLFKKHHRLIRYVLALQMAEIDKRAAEIAANNETIGLDKRFTSLSLTKLPLQKMSGVVVLTTAFTDHTMVKLKTKPA